MSRAAAPRAARRFDGRDLAVGLLLFAVSAGVYLESSTRGFLDPKYALLTTQSLLERGSWDLAPYFADGACDPAAPPTQFRKDAWQLFCVRGQLLYIYPPGASVLSMPLVALLRWSGRSAVGADGRYDLGGELALHDRACAVLTALTVVLIFAAARRELPRGASAALALLAAFGTTLWSIASQQMWSHTWSALLFAATLVELQRWESGDRRRPLWLGALLVAAFWCRPTNAVLAACTTLFVAWRHRAALPRLVVAGGLGLAAYFTWSWSLFASPLPLYVSRTGASSFGTAAALEVLAGVFFAPTVGLFVFTPVLLVVVAWLFRHGLPRERRALAGWALAVVVLGIAPFALRSAGWGGGPRAPRFFTEFVPLLAWLGALAWRARREAPASWRPARFAGSALAVGLAVASVAAQGITATRFGTPWNDPLSALRLVEGAPYEPEKIWLWSEAPQVALWRTLTEEPPPRRRRRAPAPP
jgi:hypothetical protein